MKATPFLRIYFGNGCPGGSCGRPLLASFLAALGPRHTGEPVSTTNVQYVYPVSSPSVAAITSSSAYFSADCFPFLPVFLVSFGAGLLEVGQVSSIVASGLGNSNYGGLSHAYLHLKIAKLILLGGIGAISVR